MLYIPILITVIKYGIKYGSIVAIISGLAVGPFMNHASTNAAQPAALGIKVVAEGLKG